MSLGPAAVSRLATLQMRKMALEIGAKRSQGQPRTKPLPLTMLVGQAGGAARHTDDLTRVSQACRV